MTTKQNKKKHVIELEAQAHQPTQKKIKKNTKTRLGYATVDIHHSQQRAYKQKKYMTAGELL